MVLSYPSVTFAGLSCIASGRVGSFFSPCFRTSLYILARFELFMLSTVGHNDAIQSIQDILLLAH